MPIQKCVVCDKDFYAREGRSTCSDLCADKLRKIKKLFGKRKLTTIKFPINLIKELQKKKKEIDATINLINEVHKQKEILKKTAI